MKSGQCDQGPRVHNGESSRELGMHSVTNMRERSLMTHCNYFKMSYRDDGDQFLVVAGGKTKWNELKLWVGRF